MSIGRQLAILALGGILARAAAGALDCGEAGAAGFGLRAVDLEVAGNTGPVSFIVKGSKFDAQTDFALRDAGGSSYPAAKVVRINENRALVTFDLAGAAAGLADIAATGAGGAVATLEDALDVRDGLGGQLFLDLNLPREMVAGEPAPMEVVYANTGHADVAVPLLHVAVPGATYLGRVPQGHSMGAQALILGVPDSPVANTLRPGERTSVPLFVQVDALGSDFARVTALDPQAADLSAVAFDDAQIVAQNPGNAFVAAGLAAIRQEYGENLQSYYMAEMAHLAEIAEAGANAYDRVQHIEGRWHLEPSLTPPHGPEVAPGRAPDPATPPVPLPAPPPPSGDGNRETHAIIVGINQYAGNEDLQGAVRDASFVYNHFKFELRLPNENIQYFPVSEGSAPFTEQDMLDAIRNAGADGDDNLVIYFAGHGTYLADASKPDGFTGALCMSDLSVYEDHGYLRADELDAAIAEKGAGQTYVIMDACHSGYMVRDLVAPHTAAIGSANLDQVAADTFWPLDAAKTSRFQSGAFTPFFVQLLREGVPLDEAVARARDYVNQSGYEQTAVFNPDHVDVGNPFGDVDPVYLSGGSAYLDTYLGLFSKRMENLDETDALLPALGEPPPEKIAEFMAEATAELGADFAPGGVHYSSGRFDQRLQEKIAAWKQSQPQQLAGVTRSFGVVTAPDVPRPPAFVPGGFAASPHSFLFYVTDNSNGRILLVNLRDYKDQEWLPILDGLEQPGDLDLDPAGRFLCYSSGGEVHRVYLGVSIRVRDRMGAPLAGAHAVLETALGTHTAIVDVDGYAHFLGVLEPQMRDSNIFIEIAYQGARQTFSGVLNRTDHTVLRLEFTADPSTIAPASNSTTPEAELNAPCVAGPGDGDRWSAPVEVLATVMPGQTTFLPDIPVFTGEAPPAHSWRQSQADPPVVSVAAPASGLASSNGNQAVFGSVNSGGVTSVNVVVNGATNSVPVPFMERDYCLEVSLPPGTNRIVVQGVQNGAPAGTPATAEVRIDPAFDGATGALAGRVVNQYRQGAAGVAVIETYNGTETATDANGYYQFSGLPVGPAAIRVEP